MSEEEKEKLEQEFQYALDNIVSKIKGETATAIVVSEQSMILLFKRLMLKIEKQSKEIEELKDLLEYVKSEYEDTIEHQQKEIEDCKFTAKYVEENYISKDTIKAKIEELEKEQEDNRKSLYNAINILYFKEIDKISNRISVNMTVIDILRSLLKEEKQ